MLRRYFYLIFMFGFLAGSSWFAQHLEPVATREVASPKVYAEPATGISKRVLLIEFLDKVVAYEHYYRAVYGHFTKVFTRLGLTVPAGIREVYEIRINEASAERFVVVALSEIDGKTVDLASVDQAYQLKTNFSVPPPRPEYLRAKALKHLRSIRDSMPGQIGEDAGLYGGYFRFDVRDGHDGMGERAVFAVGIRPPVLGMQLEPGTTGLLAFEVSAESEQGDVELEHVTGQTAVANAAQDEVYLAQKIFRGEMGRYAKNWSELSKIVAFRFDDKERLMIEPETPSDTGDDSVIAEVDLSERKPAQTMESQSEGSHGLIVEPIAAGY